MHSIPDKEAATKGTKGDDQVVVSFFDAYSDISAKSDDLTGKKKNDSA